jgi:hypothetical protein
MSDLDTRHTFLKHVVAGAMLPMVALARRASR